MPFYWLLGLLAVCFLGYGVIVFADLPRLMKKRMAAGTVILVVVWISVSSVIDRIVSHTRPYRVCKAQLDDNNETVLWNQLTPVFLRSDGYTVQPDVATAIEEATHNWERNRRRIREDCSRVFLPLWGWFHYRSTPDP